MSSNCLSLSRRKKRARQEPPPERETLQDEFRRQHVAPSGWASWGLAVGLTGLFFVAKCWACPGCAGWVRIWIVVCESCKRFRPLLEHQELIGRQWITFARLYAM